MRLNPVLLLLLLLFGTACRNDLKKIHSTLDRRMLNTERAEEVTILYSKEGQTKAQLKTKTFTHIQNTTPAYIEMRNGLRVEFFDDSLRPATVLTAKYGKMFEDTGNVLVRDSVRVANSKGETLQTEELVWNEKIQRFFTEKPVVIITPSQVIFGDGLESNQTFTEYSITNVKGMLNIDKKDMPFP